MWLGETIPHGARLGTQWGVPVVQFRGGKKKGFLGRRQSKSMGGRMARGCRSRFSELSYCWGLLNRRIPSSGGNGPPKERV